MKNQIIIKGYVVRDKEKLDSTDLRLFQTKPLKLKSKGFWNCVYASPLILPSNCFPNIKWTDDTPTEVEITIKIK